MGSFYFVASSVQVLLLWRSYKRKVLLLLHISEVYTQAANFVVDESPNQYLGYVKYEED